MPKQVTAQERLWRQATEAQVQATLIAALDAHWWAYSHHPDSRQVSGAGIPDLVALRPGEVLFLEAKRETGARWYPRQKLWCFGLEATPGVEYWIAKPSTLDAVLCRLQEPMRVEKELWQEQLRIIREQEAIAKLSRRR